MFKKPKPGVFTKQTTGYFHNAEFVNRCDFPENGSSSAQGTLHLKNKKEKSQQSDQLRLEIYLAVLTITVQQKLRSNFPSNSLSAIRLLSLFVSQYQPLKSMPVKYQSFVLPLRKTLSNTEDVWKYITCTCCPFAMQGQLLGAIRMKKSILQ